MNTKQRVIVLIGTLFILAMGLFPPWAEFLTYEKGTTPTAAVRYAPFYSPPAMVSGAGVVAVWHLSTDRLYAEWACVVLVTLGLALVSGKERKPSPS